MSPLLLLLSALGGFCVIFSLFYLLARRINNYGVVDIVWSYAFAALVLLYAFLGEGWMVRKALIATMTVLWSLRLGTHLCRRVISHHPVEDGRYAQLRKDWAHNFAPKMFGFFQMQAASVVLLGAAFFVICLNPTRDLHPLEYAGAILWLLALTGEAISDSQLAAFKRDKTNQGRVCDVGLWHFSRHPNYFFEWMIWVSYFVFALASPWGWVAAIGPLSILYLLLRVTGIPLTEEQSLRSKGNAYRHYQKTTSAFIPWFPKKNLMIDALLKKDLLPDWLIRIGIRRLLRQRLREEASNDNEGKLRRFAEELRQQPIAVNTTESKEQHYEVPTLFYQKSLGPRLKYSSAFYERGDETLAQAEKKMLALTCERARISDGLNILELGCGWGSLTLWMAEKYPGAHITAVSHSRTQREHITGEATKRGLGNITVITCDMNDFVTAPGQFDRVVSVEMFEHMKNWPQLMANIARWLKPGGFFFAHVFVHARFAYHFVVRDETDWMSKYFFTGGQMPSHDLFSRFQDDVKLVNEWKVNGTHYSKTSEHWLQNMDANRADIMPLFVKTYGEKHAVKWWAYWRVFYLSCAELWNYRKGEEWHVSHYLFQKP